MLQIRNLNIIHKKDLRTIIEDFTFALNPGDKAVLIGEEGNGKSTLVKWIYDPKSIEDYAEAEGECIYSGEKLGYLPQELPAHARDLSVYEFFCEGELFWEQEPRSLGELAKNLHLPVEFFYSEQRMGTLSGGEKVKAQIARIFMGKPTILLLDEPSNDIDIETLEWLEELIVKAPQAVLFISHDETLIEKTANVVIHLEQIRRKTKCRYTVAKMPYAKYIEERRLSFKRQEMLALNDRREKKIRDEKLKRIEQSVASRLDNISKAERDGPGRLLKKKMKAVKSMERRFEREAEDMTKMPESEEAIFFKFGQEIQLPAGKVVLDLELERLLVAGISGEAKDLRQSEQELQRSKHALVLSEEIPVQREGAGSSEKLEKDKVLAEHIHLLVRGSEKVCIVGKNGVGKTTLLKEIAERLSVREDLKVAYMPQNYEELLDMTQTPVEYLCETGDKEEVTRIRTWLGSLKYTADEMSHPIAELSGGQKAKVLLLKMSISGANVLLLDEPTRNFSPLSNPVIREVLRDYAGAIISVSHDRKYISEVCDKVYELTEEGLRSVEG